MKQIITARNIALFLSLLVAISSVFVLLCWGLDFFIIKDVVPESMIMKPMRSLEFFLCSISLIFLVREPNRKFIRFGIILISLVIILLALFCIAVSLFDINLKVEQILFKSITKLNDLTASGVMSTSTAFCLLSIGFVLLISAVETNLHLREPCIAALGTIVIVISGLAILSNLLIMLLGINFWNYSGITIYPAINLMLLGVGLLAFNSCKSSFNWSLNALITSGFIIAILTLLATSFSSYQYTNQLRQDDEQVSSGQIAIKEINDISFTMAKLESSQRGFIITGDNNLLHDRLQNKTLVQKSLAVFLNLSNEEINQHSRGVQLKKLIDQRNDWGDLTIRVRQQQGFSSAQKMIITNKGIILTNQINQLLTEMKNREYVLFDQSEKIENDMFVKTFALLPLGTFLSLTMLMLGLFILNGGIDERRKLEGSSILLAAIVNSSNDAIIGKNTDGIITSWNKAAERIFGYRAKEIIGQHMARLIPDERQSEELEILNKIRKGEIIEHFETLRKRKDGQLINISATISPIKDSNNEIIGASKIVRDITETKRLEQQLRQSQKMEAVGQLTGGVAHDFNNLLGVIIGNLDLLERMLAGNENALQRVMTTLKAATRGADLTKRLLAFSRMQQLNPEPTSLEQSINNMVEIATRAIGPEIKIITEIDKSVPPVFVDASGLENALLNLVVNARDAMPKGGVITISTQLKKLEEDYIPVQAGEMKPGICAYISVTDNGQGMSRETLDHAFEPFFTTKPRSKGTGLGLSMVFGFIKQSGGIIHIYSELDHGTTVSFYLPLADTAPLLSEQTTVTERQLEPKSSRTVLIVDDEVDLLEIAAIYLKDMGYNVLQATDAISALTIVEQEPDIDLLVTDIIMPGGMNGVELAEQVRKQKQNIIVIYTSGFPSSALAERSGTKVDAPLINKPYQRKEFVSVIHDEMLKKLNG